MAHIARWSRLAPAVLLWCAPAWAQLVEAVVADFQLPGTQVGDVDPRAFRTHDDCRECHLVGERGVDPMATWSGSLMALGGRDPLFFAQLTTANQDVANAGYFCIRCHLPMSLVTGHMLPPDGSALDEVDRGGVTCHICHAMVDPLYSPETSPPEDLATLDRLEAVPDSYGNAMLVLDRTGLRRGPHADAAGRHDVVASTFLQSSEMCGTCHDVGNPTTTRQPDGTWRYNDFGAPPPSADLRRMFPLERTYTEWALSAFARGGVDLAGRFGGRDAGVVETCQDCHMPAARGASAVDGPERAHLARHDFAGAAAQALDLIAEFVADDPNVDRLAILRARNLSVSMLQRAVSLTLRQTGRRLVVRVTNETGHKLPTGHIEGRRVWIGVRFLDGDAAVVREHGRYDAAEAELHTDDTVVYEMHVGLSEAASRVTGLPAGPSGHMVLADTIVKDNRIPPRGFVNAAFEAAGAPVVGWAYADGEHWDEASFPVPEGAVRAAVTVYYQSTPRHYIEALRDANVTDDWGDTLFALWAATGRGAPISMASEVLALSACAQVDDCDGDGSLAPADCDDDRDTVWPGAAEPCDGHDNDCDGVVDEGGAGAGDACETGVGGICAAGERRCRDGVLRCDPVTAPSAERCDGLDHDCDGEVDEARGACDTGEPGPCRAGTSHCAGGEAVCVPEVRPAPESCDGRDEDCDGRADEDFDVGAECTAGLGECRAAGHIACEAGGGSACDATPAAAQEELCDELDNDCDGEVDEGFNVGWHCYAGGGLIQCAPGGGTDCIPLPFDAATPPDASPDAAPDTSPDAAPDPPERAASRGCRLGAGPSAPEWLLLFAIIAIRRRR